MHLCVWCVCVLVLIYVRVCVLVLIYVRVCVCDDSLQVVHLFPSLPGNRLAWLLTEHKFTEAEEFANEHDIDLEVSEEKGRERERMCLPTLCVSENICPFAS